jgi:hypothetical protein
MPQSVFDVGDLITSRLTLGVTPDGTTSATVTVYRPGGVALTGLNTTAWAGDQKSVQWYATDDGTAGGIITAGVADGDWLAIWRVTGTGASVTPKVYPVAPLPGTSTRPAWSPFLSDVADHVPWLTVDTITPGAQTYLGTFTGTTTPTDEQVQRHIDTAVAMTGALLGTLPASMYRMARGVATVRAAASVARAFPRNRSDIDTADRLATQAVTDMTALTSAAETGGTVSPTGAVPVMYAPESPWYADLDL